MASPSDLEGRVLAILDPQRNHRSLKRKTCYALMLVAALLLIPCALLRLGYAEAANPGNIVFRREGGRLAQSPQSPKSEEAGSRVHAAPAGVEAGRTITTSPSAQLDVSTGKVLDPSGKPVAGAPSTSANGPVLSGSTPGARC